jgi:hypothetical protein
MSPDKFFISVFAGFLSFMALLYLFFLGKAFVNMFRWGDLRDWRNYGILTGTWEFLKVFAVLLVIGILSWICYNILYVKG